MLDGLAAVSGVVMAKALAEAIAFCGPPNDDSRLPLRSDQHWAATFSTASVTAEQIQSFLSSCQFVRNERDYGRAAEIVNAFIQSKDFDPLVDIEKLAMALREVNERRLPQTLGASSIAMFAKRSAKVFIWDELPDLSVRLSASARLGEADTSAWTGGSASYASYAEAYDDVLAELRASSAFQDALQRFTDYLAVIAGPFRSRDQTPMDFIERRLADRVLANEGWYLRYWLETPGMKGKVAPADEGLHIARVVPRRGQDVFSSEIAAKYGF
jgi:hypothetical protein